MKAGTGQAAIEQLVIMMLLFVVLLSVFIYSNTNAMGSARVEQASEAIRAVASAADKIGAMDAGTKMFVGITLPDGIILANVSQSEILMRVETPSGETDVVESPNTQMTGNLPTGAGVYTVQLEVLNTSVVNISTVSEPV
ncbi:MAG: hypothetical protein V1839_01315 [archaeon]